MQQTAHCHARGAGLVMLPQGGRAAGLTSFVTRQHVSVASTSGTSLPSSTASQQHRSQRLDRLAMRSGGGWRAMGPTSEHSDGDAEYYSLTSRLSQQYDWFAPKQADLDREEEEANSSRWIGDTGLLAPTAQQVQQTSRRVDTDQRKPQFGLSPGQISALGLAGPRANTPDPKSLSSRAFMGGDRYTSDQFGFNAARATQDPSYKLTGATGATMAGRSNGGGARAAYGDYQTYPEGRPIFLPEAERYGNPPDLPSLLLQQRVIYISMPFLPSVTELVVAQCYYLDFDDKNRNKPIYVYLNSTGCMNEKGQAISADNEFYAMWSALGFTRAPLYTGVTWKAQNQAAVLLASGVKGHRYTYPRAKISTAPPILNRVYGQSVDAQLQANELEYATKYYAAILARATGKDLATAQKEYLNRKRYFSVKEAYEEGLVDKLVPGFKLNRLRHMASEMFGDGDGDEGSGKPTFRFKREQAATA